MASFGCCDNIKVVMVSSGESEWGERNLFSGWYDTQLSLKGKQEARIAGITLNKENYKFDVAYTSQLTRAQETLELVLKQIEQFDLPVVKTWRLNERHYGALTGLNKDEIGNEYSEEQVAAWRWGYDVPPPPMEPDHLYYRAIVEDTRYKDEPDPSEFPQSESLKMTIDRCLPFWNKSVVPEIQAGKRVLIAAHNNSLRGLVKHLDKISDDDITKLDLPTGIRFVYTLDMKISTPFAGGRLRYLGDPEVVKRAIATAANRRKVATK